MTYTADRKQSYPAKRRRAFLQSVDLASVHLLDRGARLRVGIYSGTALLRRNLLALLANVLLLPVGALGAVAAHARVSLRSAKETPTHKIRPE